MLDGLAAALSVAGILDTVTLGYPLASLWRYVIYNFYYEASSTFGVEPWDYYLRGEFGVWGGASPSLLLLVILGGRRAPSLLVAAVTIIAVHSGIGHKEYRFIYPAILLAMVLAGIGLAELASWGRSFLERDKQGQSRRAGPRCVRPRLLVSLVPYSVEVRNAHCPALPYA